MAESTQIHLEAPSAMVLDQEYAVMIELSDQEGSPLQGKTPNVVFAPSKSVEQVELYDCSEPAEYDNCKPNNRGVEGVFESVFVLADSPVTMTVSVGAASKQITLEATEEKVQKTATTETKETTASSQISASTAVPPSMVRVGPTPSVSYVLLPLALMLVIVTYFVVSTTD